MPDGTESVLDKPYLEFMNNEQYYIRSDGIDIKIGKLYKLELTYNENLESYYYFIDDYFNQIATGSTITYNYTSGDTQYTIQDQMQQQQKNQDFWKKAYDSLFVVDSGDIKQVIDNFTNSANLQQYGDISGEIMILNTLRGTPTDFIITWQPVQWQRKNNNTKWRHKL